MILADTSLWVDHLHGRSTRLLPLLEKQRLVMHPFVLGEIIAGSISDRQNTQLALESLPSLPVSPHTKVVELVQRSKLYGIGLSWMDLHLLCAVRGAGARLITGDQALAAAARRVGVPSA